MFNSHGIKYSKNNSKPIRLAFHSARDFAPFVYVSANSRSTLESLTSENQ